MMMIMMILITMMIVQLPLVLNRTQKYSIVLNMFVLYIIL